MFDSFNIMTITLKSLDLPNFGISKKQPKIKSQIYLDRVEKLKNDLKKIILNLL